MPCSCPGLSIPLVLHSREYTEDRVNYIVHRLQSQYFAFAAFTGEDAGSRLALRCGSVYPFELSSLSQMFHQGSRRLPSTVPSRSRSCSGREQMRESAIDTLRATPERLPDRRQPTRAAALRAQINSQFLTFLMEAHS